MCSLWVVDVEEGRLAGDRIKAVGEISKAALPSGARVVDAKGKYLIWASGTVAVRLTACASGPWPGDS